MSPGFLGGNLGEDGKLLKLHKPFWGDFCWESQADCLGLILLLVTRACPVYLEDKLVLVFLVLLNKVRMLRWLKPRVTQELVSIPSDLP